MLLNALQLGQAVDISTDLVNSAAVRKIDSGAGASSDVDNSTTVGDSADGGFNSTTHQICPDGEITTVDSGTESNIRVNADVFRKREVFWLLILGQTLML